MKLEKSLLLLLSKKEILLLLMIINCVGYNYKPSLNVILMIINEKMSPNNVTLIA